MLFTKPRRCHVREGASEPCPKVARSRHGRSVHRRPLSGRSGPSSDGSERQLVTLSRHCSRPFSVASGTTAYRPRFSQRNPAACGHEVRLKISGSTSKRLALGARLTSLAILVLVSAAASADVYPVNGVWINPNHDFPVGADQACSTLRLWGVDAVTRKSIAQLLIFN